jgi:uncharacterized protein YbaR (Trm112 family)
MPDTFPWILLCPDCGSENLAYFEPDTIDEYVQCRQCHSHFSWEHLDWKYVGSPVMLSEWVACPGCNQRLLPLTDPKYRTALICCPNCGVALYLNPDGSLRFLNGEEWCALSDEDRNYCIETTRTQADKRMANHLNWQKVTYRRE